MSRGAGRSLSELVPMVGHALVPNVRHGLKNSLVESYGTSGALALIVDAYTKNAMVDDAPIWSMDSFVGAILACDTGFLSRQLPPTLSPYVHVLCDRDVWLRDYASEDALRPSTRLREISVTAQSLFSGLGSNLDDLVCQLIAKARTDARTGALKWGWLNEEPHEPLYPNNQLGLPDALADHSSAWDEYESGAIRAMAAKRRALAVPSHSAPARRDRQDQSASRDRSLSPSRSPYRGFSGGRA